MFTAHDVNMKFVEEWPMLKDASASIKFDNQSLFITAAHGKTRNVKLFNGSAQILDLAKAHLTVKTQAHGSNEELQSYVWNSPLDDILGNAMRLFQLEGKNDLALTIEVPLDEDQLMSALMVT